MEGDNTTETNCKRHYNFRHKISLVVNGRHMMYNKIVKELGHMIEPQWQMPEQPRASLNLLWTHL